MRYAAKPPTRTLQVDSLPVRRGHHHYQFYKPQRQYRFGPEIYTPMYILRTHTSTQVGKFTMEDHSLITTSKLQCKTVGGTRLR